MAFLKKIFSGNSLNILAIFLGIGCGLLGFESLLFSAEIIAEVTIKLMKLIAVPLLFLSIVSSAAHFQKLDEVKKLGLRILRYTVFTTLLAAILAEIIYWIAAPSLTSIKLVASEQAPSASDGFLKTFISMIPENVFKVFSENNIIAVVVIAICLALAILSTQKNERQLVFGFFSGLLNALMRIVHVGIKFLPISVWAFVLILTHQLSTKDSSTNLDAVWALTITVILANIIQGSVVLPIFLRSKNIRPLWLLGKVKEALFLAFFTRSSTAALPVTLDKCTKNAKVSEDVARLSLPLCTTINMNGCAQFILLTVYFVCAHTGNPLTWWEHIGMIFLSVVAAIGNAGVPMGCFFLASSILASKNIPLHIMGSILPLYTFIDMVESSLNVWSDIAITKVVDNETSV